MGWICDGVKVSVMFYLTLFFPVYQYFNKCFGGKTVEN